MRQCGIESGEGSGPREVAFLQESTPSHGSLCGPAKGGPRGCKDFLPRNRDGRRPSWRV